jgi:hypothetical protein
MMREALPQAAQSCSVVPAELGEKIGDVAALCAALDGLAKSGVLIGNTEKAAAALEPAAPRTDNLPAH